MRLKGLWLTALLGYGHVDRRIVCYIAFFGNQISKKEEKKVITLNVTMLRANNFLSLS